ncbi:MAG: hypothetical protein ACO1N8_12275 [Methylophilus sp.]
MQNLLKQYGLWIALVSTLAATIWASQQDDETSAPSEHNVIPKVVTNSLNNLTHKEVANVGSGIAIQRQEILEMPSNLFSTIASVENLVVTSIEEPVIANPFIYAGKLVDEGRVTVFLIEGDKSHAVKVGNVIEELWKVKSIAPPIMVLKNLSTKTEVQIEIGALS